MKDILTYALIISIVIVLWGCEEEIEEDGLLATVKEVIPPEGSEITFNSEITIKFDNPVTKVTVNGIDATGSGMIWMWNAYLRPGPATLSIEWTNEDGSAGIKSISYVVKPYENSVIKIVTSRPKDREKNVDPIRLHADGMEIEFDQPVKKVDVDIIVNDVETVKWNVELSDDKTKVFLRNIKGTDIPYDSEIILEITAESLLGYKVELKITFTTKAIE